jgi:hypothetical protein
MEIARVGKSQAISNVTDGYLRVAQVMLGERQAHAAQQLAVGRSPRFQLSLKRPRAHGEVVRHGGQPRIAVQGIGFWPAAILSAAYFGYSHHGNSGEDWIGLVNAGAFGLLACFLLRRTGNLWMPIGVHTAFDWGETYFYGVANSGQKLPGHLLNSSSSGPAWLSGGAVGPEGSVLGTLLIVIVWLICAQWLREVKYPGAAPVRNSPAAP